MIFLNKLLPIFVLPLGAVFLLLLFALWRRKRWPTALAAMFLYVASVSVVSGGLLGWLESYYPPAAIAQAARADGIVVLSGVFDSEPKPGHVPNFANSMERLEAGIMLFETGAAPWLVFTGGRIPWEGRRRVEGEDSRDAAIKRGLSADKILVTGEAGNTAEEARAVAGLMRQRGWKRVILVTTAWHMPRAAWLFRRAGVELTPFPVDYRVDRARQLTLLDFLPSARALADTETALREIYGNLFYRVWYSLVDFPVDG